ncbi:nuclear transport factor 2 family protein [Microbulbifer agarilyticus]|uniref:nuclear transport factor 2 family protein n=1 Tax=Microbulbifer agarilyticus TaxID=260552 RepID=UPI001C938AA7|nr:nuclear transport factor 2 family protein [Microbulbifer agarilyticus]MBY6188818.1 nuclear transport factor 2 family protein [Microbulbifer agarilyticus]MCA0894015.1 nuclear transport factor 2 family protein [Microbulbifer agarilyticus]
MQRQGGNCAVAQQLYDAFLAGDLDGIYALLDPNIEWELVGSEEVPHFGVYRGLDEVMRFFSIVGDINRVESFEVLSYTETEKGAYVECRERGHFAGHPQHFDIRSCQILEIESGRIVRFRIYQDTSQMVDAWRS